MEIMLQHDFTDLNSTFLVASHLVACVVEVLDQDDDGRLHQHQQAEPPREAGHQAQRPQRHDGGPQQHVDVQTHGPAHQGRVPGQPGGDLT